MENFKFTKDYYSYPSKEQGVYSIQENDWNRIKNLIQKSVPEKKLFNICYSVSFGVFASSILSLLAFYSLSSLPNWLLPTNWAITISSVILGIVLVILDNQQKEIMKVLPNFIIEEMDKIESQFIKVNK